MSILDLIRPELKRVNNYTPGGDEANCRLHANELPWSPLPDAINQYPDERQQYQLQQQLAGYYGVKTEQLVITRGSDDGIDQLMRLFLRPGQDNILQCPPTFPMYVFYAQLQNAGIINCPLDIDNNFSLKVDKLFESYRPDCKLIMLCQPNNPSGTILPLADIKQICDYFYKKAIVVVDEAYIEFSDTDSAASLIDQFDNLVVLRTLSKAYGMAGLRVGSVIAQQPLTDALRTIIAPYHIPSPVLSLAQRALENQSWFQNSIQTILAERTRMQMALQSFSWVETIYPAHGNFLLIKSPLAQALFHWLAQHDISVRAFAASSLLADMVRITIGSAEQNTRLLNCLQTFKI